MNIWRRAPTDLSTGWTRWASTAFSFILTFIAFIYIASGKDNITARGIIVFCLIALPIIVLHAVALGFVAGLAGSSVDKSVRTTEIRTILLFCLTVGTTCSAATGTYLTILPAWADDSPIFAPAIAIGLITSVSAAVFAWRRRDVLRVRCPDSARARS